jgi:hypothetical protein
MPLGSRHSRHRLAQGHGAQSGHQLASAQPGNSICHSICHGIDADHFLLDMSSCRSYVQGDF